MWPAQLLLQTACWTGKFWWLGRKFSKIFRQAQVGTQCLVDERRAEKVETEIERLEVFQTSVSSSLRAYSMQLSLGILRGLVPEHPRIPKSTDVQVLYTTGYSITLTSVAHLVEHHPAEWKGCRFDSWSGHMPGLWVQPPVGARMGEAPLRCFSLI